MKISNDKLVISKKSWVYRLLVNFGHSDRWEAPKHTGSLILMVGWRVTLLVVLALMFIVGWGLILFADPVAAPSSWVVFAATVALIESAAALLVGGLWFFGVKVPEWFNQLQFANLEIHWTEEEE